MVLLERYLQLYERESQLISSAWKTSHIFFYVVIALSGLTASYAFSRILASFDGNCFLHSNVTFVSDRTDNSSATYPIDYVKSEWGRQSDCSFCQYVPICSAIFSMVWTAFFLMCGKGGKTTQGLSQPWRIVLPSLIFNITFFGVALAAACKLNDGISVFCNLFQDDVDETNCHNLAKYQMADGNTGLQTYICMKVAQISSWINVVGWSVSVVVLLTRWFCAPDFQLIQVSILAPTPVQEQVWIGGSVASLLLLVTASEWVQLHMVEPGGKTKFKQTSCDNEQDFQIQSPEANKRTAEAETKVEALKPITKLPSVRPSDTFNDHFTGKRIDKYNTENDQSDTQLHNSELYLNHNEHVFTPPILKSHHLKPDSERNYGTQTPHETLTVIPLSRELPLESVLDTEVSDTTTPQSGEYLTSSKFNTPTHPARHELEVTTMQTDAKLPNPVTINHHSDVVNSVSKFSNTPYETKTTPNSTVKKNTENPEEIGTSRELNVSYTAAHSEALRLPGTGNSNNTTQENTAQDTSLPFDMFRAVHKTLMQETSHTIRGKMHFLQQLKDKMLHYIEGCIKGLWTTDYERQARTEKGVEFPSMEGALMSISFLIFAVFLIKLVQQLIQGLQANNMGNMSTRHSRSLPDLLTTARVLHLIDNFPLQYEDNGWT